MKRFLLKMILFAIPLIAVLAAWELIMRNAPHVFKYKRQVIMEKYRKEGRILVLGSSHAFYGVNTRFMPRACNLAFVSQELCHDRFIFETFLKSPNRLEYVIVPVSIFSFFGAKQNNDSWKDTNYSAYWGFPVSDISNRFFIFGNMPNQFRLFKRLKKKIKREGVPQAYNIDETGWGTNQAFMPREQFKTLAEKAALRHCDADLEKIDGFHELQKLIALAQKHKIKVLLFTPPAHRFYWKKISPEQEKRMRELLAELVKMPGVTYIDLLRSDKFELNDFGDGDHLTPSGAEKLARILHGHCLALSKQKTENLCQ